MFKLCLRNLINLILLHQENIILTSCFNFMVFQAVFGQHQLIDSSQIKNLTCCLKDLLPVSPPSDLQTEIFLLHDICDAMDNTLPYSNLLMNKYFIENVNQ